MKFMQTILLSLAATMASAISIPVEATQTTEATKLPLKIRYLEPMADNNNNDNSSLIIKRDCIPGDSPLQTCYNGLSKFPYQNIDVRDLRALAVRLRNMSHELLLQDEVLTITLEKTVVNDTCQSMLLMSQGSLLLQLVHLDPTIRTNVMIKDIAATLDGVYQDVETKPAPTTKGLTECGNAGGQQGVSLDPAAGYYHGEVYMALNFTPYGMLVRVVSSTLN